MSRAGMAAAAIPGLRPGLASDLSSRGGIRTVDDVLAAYDLSIAAACDISIVDARTVLHLACQASMPTASTALDLLHSERTLARVVTPLHALNAALGGGLPRGIVEVVARAGTGKTQFALCCTACALAGAPTPRVLFIDSEGTFSPLRLREMLAAAARLSPARLDHALACVTVVRVHSTEELAAACAAAGGKDAAPLTLLVVDSIAATTRAEYASAARRADDLSSIAHVLKSIAERWRIPVLVTNQITANLSRTQHSAPVAATAGDESLTAPAYDEELMPALGNTWSHCVSTRLFMRPKGSTGTSCVEIVKSPMSASTSVPFTITSAGVVPA